MYVRPNRSLNNLISHFIVRRFQIEIYPQLKLQYFIVERNSTFPTTKILRIKNHTLKFDFSFCYPLLPINPVLSRKMELLNASIAPQSLSSNLKF